MNEMMNLSFEGWPVRIQTDEDGKLWWVAKDVCEILDHSNHRMAIQGLDDDERGIRKVYPPSRPDGVDTHVINESGLYTMIIRSNKPEAKVFRRWITHELLPSIRLTGSYAAGGRAARGQLEEDEADLRRVRTDVALLAAAAKIFDAEIRIGHRLGRPMSQSRQAATERVFAITGLDYSEAVDAIEDVSGPVKRFVEACCILGGPEYRITAAELFEAFGEWAHSGGIADPTALRIGRNNFYRGLLDAEHKVRRSRVEGNGGSRPIGFIGIALAPKWSDRATQ